ncbi:MAG: 50S ribosomal protein L3 [Betaproteobacteria bacterium HGW-Betaproteobacteria-11]|nr:MAG: 50S ribosomal protein L3 [Betaproteobacteria bacterium HGW-Betaproteobacteria-11]
MSVGLVGRKVGMTRIFAEDGSSIPVTVLDVSGNRITQIKTPELDGYAAVQVAFGVRKQARITKPVAGHLAKAGVGVSRVLREFRVDSDELGNFKSGDMVDPARFLVGQRVDVSGKSIGKGFAGAIQRHNFSSNRASHGNSLSHNSAGSIGMAQDPGRVFPGKKMAGHLGDENCTIQNLVVVRVDESRSLLFIRGAIPGARGGSVVIMPAVKFPSLSGKEGNA